MTAKQDHPASMENAQATGEVAQNEAGESEGSSFDTENAEASIASEAGENEAGASEAGASEELQKQLEELRSQAEESHQRLLRAQADFDNFRRRTRQEKEELAKYASMKLIEQLLPVMDNFERAISSSKENKDFEALVKGIDMVFRQFDQILGEEGLKPMETVGQPFNPDIHQAIMQVQSEEHAEGTIVEEVQKGYFLKDKVLRPALVKVSG